MEEKELNEVEEYGCDPGLEQLKENMMWLYQARMQMRQSRESNLYMRQVYSLEKMGKRNDLEKR